MNLYKRHVRLCIFNYETFAQFARFCQIKLLPSLFILSAARVLSRTRKRDHISPVLKGLHWLPVKERIEYKILLITWKAMHGCAPSYISNLLTEYVPSRNLRSSGKNLLVTKRNVSMYGDRSFSSAAPALWNALPTQIRSLETLETFKSNLKTFLFVKAY